MLDFKQILQNTTAKLTIKISPITNWIENNSLFITTQQARATQDHGCQVKPTYNFETTIATNTRYRHTIAKLLVLSFFSLFLSISYASEFNGQQKSELKNIVHAYLVQERPDLLVEMSHALQQKEEQSTQDRAHEVISKYKNRLFKDKSSPTLGNANARVQIVEFFDYQCSHCKVAANTLERVIKQNKNLRVVFKEFPIFGKPSIDASKAALAAAKQGKYLAMHHALMVAKQHPLNRDAIRQAAKQAGVNIAQMESDMTARDVIQQIKDTRALAKDMDFAFTPVFIVSNDTVTKTSFLPGAVPQATLEAHMRKVSS